MGGGEGEGLQQPSRTAPHSRRKSHQMQRKGESGGKDGAQRTNQKVQAPWVLVRLWRTGGTIGKNIAGRTAG